MNFLSSTNSHGIHKNTIALVIPFHAIGYATSFTNGSYTVYVYTSTSSSCITLLANSGVTFYALVVAGGGAGGPNCGGGGGGGQVKQSTITISTSDTISITIGAGQQHHQHIKEKIQL